MEGIAKFAIDLIMKPGASISLVPLINVSILSLFGVLFFLLSTKIDVIHIVVMATLALGLLISVNWYVNQLDHNNSSMFFFFLFGVLCIYINRVYYEIMKMKEQGKDPFAPMISTTDIGKGTKDSDKKTD